MKRQSILMKMTSGMWFHYQMESKLLAANGCTRSKGMLMEMLNDTKRD